LDLHGCPACLSLASSLLPALAAWCLSVLCPKSLKRLGLQWDDDALLYGMLEETRRCILVELHHVVVGVGLLQQLDGVVVAGMASVSQALH
jgi:hypothetical protein